MKKLEKQILSGQLNEFIKDNNIGLVVVGSGLSGAVMAERYSAEHDKNVLMFEQRNHIAGNIYDEKDEETGILVQNYGSHIMHSNNDEVWDYVNQFTEFWDYQHKVLADTSKDIVTMPFNIQTMAQIFGTTNVQKIRSTIVKEIRLYYESNPGVDENEPKNFEEQAIALVGTTIYYALIYGYTKKQWGCEPAELPAEIIKRIPIRWNTDTTYFNNAKYQGIPANGYTDMIENILFRVKDSNEIYIVNQKFEKSMINEIPKGIKIIYTGGLDELLDYEFGELEYRSLEFKNETFFIDTYQGCAVVNYTNEQVPFTRITEHKYYMREKDRNPNITIISTEYSIKHEPTKGTIPYYPIGNERNKNLHQEYLKRLEVLYTNVIPLGRLATYQYLDMDKTIELALDCYKNNFSR
jgi:UDP-galactopyranose mutase